MPFKRSNYNSRSWSSSRLRRKGVDFKSITKRVRYALRDCSRLKTDLALSNQCSIQEAIARLKLLLPPYLSTQSLEVA